MKDHEGCRRAFVRSSKAWYAETFGGPQEIHFGMYADEGGSSGEMTMRWVVLSGKDVPQLRSFDDSWSALSLFGDLIAEMGAADDEEITEQQFVDMLLRCGFVDRTPYVQGEDDSDRAAKVREIHRLEQQADAVRESLRSTHRARTPGKRGGSEIMEQVKSEIAEDDPAAHARLRERWPDQW